MSTLVLTDLAPGRTATLQLYQRGTNTTVGSLITGTSVSMTYSFAGVPATGDYDALLAGFSTPNGARFPVRNSIGYPGVSWFTVDELDPLIGASPVAPIDYTAPIDAELIIQRTRASNVPASYFVLRDANEKLIATLTPAITGTSYSVTIPRAHTTKQRTIYWALRSTTDANSIIESGTIQFDYAATE